VWEGTIQPTPLSAIYTVRVTYGDWKSPRVFVAYPKLEPRTDAAIPHLYEDDSLCLYLPAEWSASEEYLSRTILPWAVLWLFHYERWRITGVWHGGGAHPPARKNSGSQA